MVSNYVLADMKIIAQRIKAMSDETQENLIKANKKALQSSRKRITQLEALVKKLHEENATGKISDRHFERLSAEL